MSSAKHLISEFKALEGDGVTVEFAVVEDIIYVHVNHHGNTIISQNIYSKGELENFYIHARAAVDNINFINEVKEVLNARK